MGLIWLLNIVPCAALIYVQGWKALKYVYWIWLLEFLIWKFEFAVFVYFASSIAALVLTTTTKDWKTTLEERYAELYPDQMVYNLHDGEQQIRRFQGQTVDTQVAEEREVSLLQDEPADSKPIAARSTPSIAATDTASSAASFMAAPTLTTPAKDSATPLVISIPQKEQDGAYVFTSVQSPYAMAESPSPTSYADSLPIPQSFAPSQSLADSVLSPTSLSDSLLSPQAFNDSLPTPNSLTSAFPQPTNLDEALPTPSSIADAAMSAQSGSNSVPQLHSLDAFMAPLPAVTPQGNCDKCGAERNPSFSFCITCGQNF